MFCLHHDDATVVGQETVPCPLCGHGAPATEASPEPAAEPKDSNDALHHAMALVDEDATAPTGEGDRLVNLRTYW